MIYNKKVDIIIPAYNVPDRILTRSLSSIACQDDVDNIEVTIVDDASTKQNYKRVIKQFKSILKINLLRYEVNKGPGVARQYGLDNTKNEYIIFLDADDVLSGHFAITALKDLLINNPEAKMSMGNVEETQLIENETHIFPKVFNFVWLFGKMYRRDFIKKYDIRFHPTSRANEDVGFNSIYTLLCNEENEIVTTEDVVYYWLYNEKSITRENNNSYTYRSDKTGCFYGYAQNKIYAIKKVKEHLNDNEKLLEHLSSVLITFYAYYLECFNESETVAEENLIWCKWFYEECCKDIFNNVSMIQWAKAYNGIMGAKHQGETILMIPKVDFFSWLKKIEEIDKKRLIKDDL